MTSQREQAHQLIDRLPETQLSALVGLLETIVNPVATALRNAPVDDEPETAFEDMAALDKGIARRVKQADERFADTGAGNVKRL